MTRLVPLIVALLGFGIAACGGDDDGGSAPTKAEFAKDADKVCKDTEKEIEKIGQGASSPDALADAIDKVIAASKNAANKLTDLERPDGDAGDTATKFAEGFEQELNDKLIPALEKLKKAIQDKDAQAAQAAAADLQKLESTQSDKYARELGATACVGSA
jgi:soluble cytochrome b562